LDGYTKTSAFPQRRENPGGFFLWNVSFKIKVEITLHTPDISHFRCCGLIRSISWDIACEVLFLGLHLRLGIIISSKTSSNGEPLHLPLITTIKTRKSSEKHE
jgi:hypothetical protein